MLLHVDRLIILEHVLKYNYEEAYSYKQYDDYQISGLTQFDNIEIHIKVDDHGGSCHLY